MFEEKREWSEETKNLTHAFVEARREAMMKNIDGRFGLMGYLAERIVIVEHGREEPIYYASVEKLLEDGWVVD
ncbi:hypothetical protein [Hydrogenimonas sp.]